MTEENGSAAVVPEAPVGPDPASFSMQTAAVDEGELPADFERLWKAAHDNPQDFTSWTDLLQYCEQEVCLLFGYFYFSQTFAESLQLLHVTFGFNASPQGHVTASRRALEAFLVRYPLCYGYWKKFADLERRTGYNDKAEEVTQESFYCSVLLTAAINSFKAI